MKIKLDFSEIVMFTCFAVFFGWVIYNHTEKIKDDNNK